MRFLIAIAFLSCSFLVGCKPPVAVEKPPLKIGTPVSYKNLTIFPIISNKTLDVDQYTTLDEALRNDWVDISEVGSTSANQQADNAQNNNRVVSGSVNTVVVDNKSDKPLYLMPGEIIYGGKQDRAVEEQIVIRPHSGPIPVSVYCVEHGRWQSRNKEKFAEMIKQAESNSTLSTTVALPKNISKDQLAKKANQGKFVGSLGLVSKKTRLAIQKDKDQSKVWDSVYKANASNYVSSKSDNFNGNYTEAAAVQKLTPYLESIQNRIGKTRQVVGIIVAINGKFDQVEIFQSTPLFKKLWPKLMKNYALDAASTYTKEEKSIKLAKLTCPAADQFLTELFASSGKSSTTGNSSVTTTQTESANFIMYTCNSARATPSETINSGEYITGLLMNGQRGNFGGGGVDGGDAFGVGGRVNLNTHGNLSQIGNVSDDVGDGLIDERPELIITTAIAGHDRRRTGANQTPSKNYQGGFGNLGGFGKDSIQFSGFAK